jgi:uncharacterized protein
MTDIGDKSEYADMQSKVGYQTGLVAKCILYLLAFTAGEYIIYNVNLAGGIIVQFVILLGLFITSAINSSESQRRFWLALALVPLIRIASLVMPTAETSEIFWYILIAVPVIAAIIALMRKLRLSADDIGINTRSPFIQALVSVAGVGLGFIDFLILAPEALTSQLNLQMTIFPGLVLLVFTGFMEEIAFRGLLQREASALGFWGWIYIASVYAVLQLGHGSLGHTLFSLGVALYFGWIVKKTGSIWGVGLAHGLLNVSLFLIFPHLF